MKTRWLMTACATAVIAFTSMAAVAQNKNDQNRGQTNTQYRKFNQKQQQAARTYYNQNKHQEVFKPDSRWNDDYENRLKPGYVLDNDMRGMSRPAPIELTRDLGPAPRGYRYVVIGGHVVLIDSGYRVHDTIHLHVSL